MAEADDARSGAEFKETLFAWLILGLCWGYIGIMKNRTETTIMVYLAFRVNAGGVISITIFHVASCRSWAFLKCRSGEEDIFTWGMETCRPCFPRWLQCFSEASVYNPLPCASDLISVPTSTSSALLQDRIDRCIRL